MQKVHYESNVLFILRNVKSQKFLYVNKNEKTTVPVDGPYIFTRGYKGKP